MGFLHDKFDLQLLGKPYHVLLWRVTHDVIEVRYVLVAYNVLGFSLLRRAVFNRYGRPVGLWFALLTCTQFHVPFWMGRTLPNMFAFLPGTLLLLSLYYI